MVHTTEGTTWQLRSISCSQLGVRSWPGTCGSSGKRRVCTVDVMALQDPCGDVRLPTPSLLTVGDVVSWHCFHLWSEDRTRKIRLLKGLASNSAAAHLCPYDSHGQYKKSLAGQINIILVENNPGQLAGPQSRTFSILCRDSSNSKCLTFFWREAVRGKQQ